jgi:branched-chain amino acid transport system substrate-binding protein
MLARRLSAAVLATLLLVASAACAATPTPPPPLVLAADLALSGTGAAAGTVYQRALELRVEQVNQRLPAGRRVELRVKDNRSDPATAAVNLAEVAADPTVTAVVSGGCTACVVATAADLDAAGLPTVALAAGDAVAAPPSQRRYVFQLAPPAAATADLLVAELHGAGVAEFALVTVDDDGGAAADGAREVAAAARVAGLDLVLHERLTIDRVAGPDPEPVTAAAERVASWRPEPAPFDVPGGGPEPAGPAAVVLWAPAAQAEVLAVALRHAGWTGRFFLAPAAAGGLFLTGAAESALAGARLVFTETLAIDEVIATSPARTARQLWWRDYISRYGGYDAYASFAADAVDLLLVAAERAGSTERRPLRDTLAATHLDGLTGPIRFRPDAHSGLQPLALTVLVASGDRWRPAG